MADVFDPNFVEVYNKTSGVKQVIPADWLDHETLGADFSTTPTVRAREVVDVENGTPDDAWTIAQLRDRADRDGIDLAGLTLKADILAAVLAGPATPTGTTTTPNPSDTNTPGTGDEE